MIKHLQSWKHSFRKEKIQLASTEHKTPAIKEDSALPLKRRIIVSDLHLGAGDGREDFIGDFELSGFIRQHVLSLEPTELIIAGDGFEMLQVSPSDIADEDFSEHAAIARIKLIHEAHDPVFQALKDFLANPKSQLTILVGNHDFDLHYTQVKNYLYSALDLHIGSPQLRFGTSYLCDGVLVVHGNQTDPWNNFEYFSGICQPYEIIKGTQIVKYIVNTLETDQLEYASLIDNTRPILAFFQYLFTLEQLPRPVVWRFIARLLVHIARLLLNPAPEYLPPSDSPDPLVKKQSYAQDKQNQHSGKHPAEAFIHLAQQPVYKSVRVFVSGHTHQAASIPLEDGRLYINTGTWTDVIYDMKTLLRKNKQFPFAEVQYHDDTYPVAALYLWNGTHVVHFSETDCFEKDV